MYKIICPDGQSRNFPYHLKDDAESDAKCYTSKADGCNDINDPDWDPKNPCPGGTHTVKNLVSVNKVTIH